MSDDCFLTYDEFKKLVDNIVDDYSSRNHALYSVDEFLEGYFPFKNSYLKVNPIDLICEIHKCNENCDILTKVNNKENRYEFTDRFYILMGICKLIEVGTRPKPKFNNRDIITDGKTVWNIIAVKNRYCEYRVEDIAGNSCLLSFNFVNINCRKIGEVTDDVANADKPICE